jgi:hypothetical protein
MMNSALFLFGMKFYRQETPIEFFDADFLNIIQVSSGGFDGKTLRECCNIINEYLIANDFSGKPLVVGQLKKIGDFDLGSTIFDKENKGITLRMNSFDQALELYNCLRMEHKQSINLDSQ